MKVLELIKSFFSLLLARSLNIIVRNGCNTQATVVVGCNYGDGIDNNLVALVKRLQAKNLRTVFVSNHSKLEGVENQKRGSFKATMSFLNSSTAFYTHSPSDIVPHVHKLVVLKRCIDFPRMVFLQHGIIGLKSCLSNGVSMSSYIRSLERSFDYMVVSSDMEKSIVEDMGVPSEKLKITGLPRFDLYEVGQKPLKQLLVFFTWQEDHTAKQKINEVENSDGMKCLISHGFNTHIREHKMQNRRCSQNTNGANIASFESLVRSSALLITDDSSVAWDFFYMGREVIFYRPSNSWLMQEAWLVERCCRNVTELNQKINEYLKGDLHSVQLPITKYRDSNNSDRVLSLISDGSCIV